MLKENGILFWSTDRTWTAAINWMCAPGWAPSSVSVNVFPWASLMSPILQMRKPGGLVVQAYRRLIAKEKRRNWGFSSASPGGEVAPHSSSSCFENPMDKGVWELQSRRGQRVRHEAKVIPISCAGGREAPCKFHWCRAKSPLEQMLTYVHMFKWESPRRTRPKVLTWVLEWVGCGQRRLFTLALYTSDHWIFKNKQELFYRLPIMDFLKSSILWPTCCWALEQNRQLSNHWSWQLV